MAVGHSQILPIRFKCKYFVLADCIMRIGFDESSGNIAKAYRLSLRGMFGSPTVRLGLPALLLLVAAAAGMVSFGTHSWQPRLVKSDHTVAVTDSLNASRPVDQVLSSSTLAQANVVIGALSPRQAGPDQNSAPTFDVARIEPTGEAVIAGTAAPGAVVELLLDGKVLDRAVANSSGQFVITPSPLPVGEHQLSLRSTLPDNRQSASEHSVTAVVKTNLVTSSGIKITAAPEPKTQVANVSEPLPRLQSPPTLRLSSRDGFVSGRKRHVGTILVVSNGDNLWRISRARYGRGEAYPVIYHANRSRISDPDRIYPGQVIVVPGNAP
jgi:hypothetical protein